MIIEFHIHYTPEELVRDQLGPDGSPRTLFLDSSPAYTYHGGLFTLEKHIACMDKAGIDITVLSSGAGLTDDLNRCHRVNDKLKEVEERFPGRFLGLAHVPPLGGGPSTRELERAVFQLGFKGISIPSVIGKTELDAPELWPFFQKVNEMTLFIFIHTTLSSSGAYLDYHLGKECGQGVSVSSYSDQAD